MDSNKKVGWGRTVPAGERDLRVLGLEERRFPTTPLWPVVSGIVKGVWFVWFIKGRHR